MLRRYGLAITVLVVCVLSFHNAPSAHAIQPINFIRGTVLGSGFTTTSPTVVQMGPDGRLYVAQGDGRIQALTLDPNTKQVTAVQQVASATDLQEVYGIAFDPADNASPPTLYVTNTVAGLPPDTTDPSTFPGKVTRLSGPNYATRTDIITGLPITKAAHEANDLAFGPDGRLYIEQGSSTNAGIVNPAPNVNFPLFLYPDTPISGAILVADVKAPGFNGNVIYSPMYATNPNIVQTGGFDVSVYAPGFRNPYGMVWHSNGNLYATDNGPNSGYGGTSTTCTNPSVGDAAGLDELNLVEAGKYYGHANRNRGAAGDARQCLYHYGVEASTADYTAPIESNLPASSDGLAEYTAATFGGQMQGDLLYAAWVNSELHRVQLAADGHSVVSDTTLATGLQNALSVAAAQDGTIYVAEYGGNKITFLKPDETPVGSITLASIQPNAGPPAGGQAVTIKGTNFTTAADTVATIGGQLLQNVQVVNSQTITGVTPPHANGLADVSVTNSVGFAQLVGGYKYAQSGIPNTPPIADAGADQQMPIAHGDHSHAILDASASFDPDGYLVSFAWNEGATVVGTTQEVAIEVTAGVHTFTLTVTDDAGATATDTMTVEVSNSFTGPPYICADIDGDGIVKVRDFSAMLNAWNAVDGQPAYSFFADVNRNKKVEVGDFSQLLSWWNKSCPTVDREIRAVTVATMPYRNVANAQADGFVQATGFIPGHTTHWINTTRMYDGVFDLTHPEGLLYMPKTGGGWELWGVFYYVPLWLPGNELPPFGFTGLEDAWHAHEGLCIYPNLSVRENTAEADCVSAGGNWTAEAGWLMHLWNFVPNPQGRMVEINPNALLGN